MKIINSGFTGNGRSTQFVTQFINYTLNPSAYEYQFVDTINKLINKAFQIEGYIPVRREIEDDSDVRQEFRLLIFKKLREKVSIEEMLLFLESDMNRPYLGIPANLSYEEKLRAVNKKLYNFMMVTLRLGIINRMKKLYKTQDRVELESNIISSNFKDKKSSIIEESLTNPFPTLFTDGSLERKVSNLLASGYTKVEIKRHLGVSAKTLSRVLDKIKDAISEEL